MSEGDLLDQVCDPMTSDATRDRLRAILRLMAGLPAAEVRELLRLANNAVDCLPVMPTLDS